MKGERKSSHDLYQHQHLSVTWAIKYSLCSPTTTTLILRIIRRQQLLWRRHLGFMERTLCFWSQHSASRFGIWHILYSCSVFMHKCHCFSRIRSGRPDHWEERRSCSGLKVGDGGFWRLRSQFKTIYLHSNGLFKTISIFPLKGCREWHGRLSTQTKCLLPHLIVSSDSTRGSYWYLKWEV